MEYKGIKVLVLGGAGKQTLTIIRGLKDIGCIVTVFCLSKLDLCYQSRLPDYKLLRPDATKGNYIKVLLEIVSTHQYDVLMPIGDASTNPVTQHESELKKYVRLACAPREIYIKAFDKQQTFEIATQNNIPAPKTRLINQTVEEYLSTVRFPLIIKPRNGVGSVGFHKFEKKKDFEPYIKDHHIDIDSYVLQEFVDYDKRLGTILFLDQKNNVCMAYADEVLREYPIDAGSACCIRSIDAPDVLDWSSKLLKAMHWQGLAALSFMVDKNTGEPKLLEINGRIPASVRLSRQCGFNVAKLFIELAYDENVEQYKTNEKIGLITRQINLDFMWLLKAPNRFKTTPSWFSWKNAKDALIWGDDLKPFFAFTLQSLLGLKNTLKKKRH